jgi:hypothetical protein
VNSTDGPAIPNEQYSKLGGYTYEEAQLEILALVRSSLISARFFRMSNPLDDDVAMESQSFEEIGSLLKLHGNADQDLYLVKIPRWLADQISCSKPGRVIGQSSGRIGRPLASGSAVANKVSLKLSDSFPKSGNPAEYTISLSAGQQNLRVLERSGNTTVATKVTSTAHMIPKRDEKYTSVLRDRLAQSDQSKQHRTVVNDDEYATSRTAVKLFQRAESSPDAPAPLSSPEAGLRGSSKRIRQLDELPQKQIRGVASSQSMSLDDALMETLVNNDQGWPLQMLSKALKDNGVIAPMNQLKNKLLEICVYQRRGEDNYPKYYLKSEYK